MMSPVPEPLRDLYTLLALGFLALALVSFIQYCKSKK
jgi:hypothetical protein